MIDSVPPASLELCVHVCMRTVFDSLLNVFTVNMTWEKVRAAVAFGGRKQKLYLAPDSPNSVDG